MSGTIICYGDSNTYGYDPCMMAGDRYPEEDRWTEILERETDWKIEDHGICGRCIPHTGSQIRFACEQLRDWQDMDAPVQLWIMLGTNDLLQERQFTAEDTAQRKIRQPTDTSSASPSATGSAIHTPFKSKAIGSSSTAPASKTMVRANEMPADTKPLHSAVKKAEAKIFTPTTKNDSAKIRNPYKVISNRDAWSVKILISG